MEQLRESELVHFSNGVYHGFLTDGRLKEVFGAFLWDNGDFYIGKSCILYYSRDRVSIRVELDMLVQAK